MFGALGLYLAVTGTHMTLTWPLKQIPVAGVPCRAADNLTFGEPAMFFGFLIFFGAMAILRAERAALAHGAEFNLVSTVRPFLYAGAFGAIGLIMIAIAGIEFGMWSPAPPDEPIARLMGRRGVPQSVGHNCVRGLTQSPGGSVDNPCRGQAGTCAHAGHGRTASQGRGPGVCGEAARPARHRDRFTRSLPTARHREGARGGLRRASADVSAPWGRLSSINSQKAGTGGGQP